MKNYLKQFMDDNNRIVGDKFQIGCETFVLTTDDTYGYWITCCGAKVNTLLILEILLGVQPITWITTRHFGPYDTYK